MCAQAGKLAPPKRSDISGGRYFLQQSSTIKEPRADADSRHTILYLRSKVLKRTYSTHGGINVSHQLRRTCVSGLYHIMCSKTQGVRIHSPPQHAQTYSSPFRHLYINGRRVLL